MDQDKRVAAEAAVAEVVDGMLVGLGTGSTAAHAIRAIGAKGLRVEAVATSIATERLAREVGIAVVPFDRVATVDLTIDGADEIDGRLRAIKGAGGAMLREKVVAAASRRMVVIADGSKRVEALGQAPVPLEVLPFATAFVMREVTGLGGKAAVRMAGRVPFVTDNGHHILDARLPLADPATVAPARVDPGGARSRPVPDRGGRRLHRGGRSRYATGTGSRFRLGATDRLHPRSPAEQTGPL